MRALHRYWKRSVDLLACYHSVKVQEDAEDVERVRVGIARFVALLIAFILNVHLFRAGREREPRWLHC